MFETKEKVSKYFFFGYSADARTTYVSRQDDTVPHAMLMSVSEILAGMSAWVFTYTLQEARASQVGPSHGKRNEIIHFEFRYYVREVSIERCATRNGSLCLQ